MRKASLLLLALLISLMFALSVYPQQVETLSEDPVEDPDPGGDQSRHPNVAKGIDPEKAVVGDLDSINLFNGNLTLTVPVGQRYPLSTRLSYQLMLTYNSTVWDFEAKSRNNIEYTAAYPDRRANAGFGWSLSLGRLFKPQAVTNETAAWIYEGSDGSDHRFFETLHLNDPFETGIGYTRDGSYLRLRAVNGMQWVEFPDGTVQEFEPDGNEGWRLRKIRDQFQSSLTISYVANAAGTVDWILNDTHGRQHAVRFILVLSDGAFVPAVDKVELAGPNGVLTYDFTYTPEATVRPCADTDDPLLGGTPEEATVQTLTRVDKPDTTQFTFGYNIVAAPGAPCFGAQLPSSGGRGTDDKSGVLTAAGLPTGGSMNWSYGEYLFPGFGAATTEIFIQHMWGVTGRTVSDPARNTVASWSYTPLLDTDAVDVATDPPNVLLNTVIDPAGNRTIHYFNVRREKTFLYGTDYGLPFSPITPDPFDNTRFLSRREFQGNPGTLLRNHYVRYEHDQGTAFIADPKNRRLVSSKTVHAVNDLPDLGPSGPTYATTNYSGFDGLGHYRTAATGGTFQSGNITETFTDYNPARGTYPAPAGQTYSMFPSGSPWVLETFSETKKTEGSSVVRKQYCFDAGTGAVKRERMLAGATPGPEDLLAVSVLDADGNAIRHDSYGGDGANLDLTLDLCSMSLPSEPAFRSVSAYNHGVLETRQFHHPSDGDPTPDTALPFKSVDVTTDANTGMLKSKRDTALRTTNYTYDPEGRLSTVTPPGEAPTVFTYRNAANLSGVFTPSAVTSTRGDNDAQVVSVREFDGLGRPWREKTLMPDSTWSLSETTINASGWVTAASERERLVFVPAQTEWDFHPSHVTAFSNFDPFGRAQTITMPDGKSSSVSFIGIRQATRKRWIATTASAEAEVSTIEDYDRQGRLFRLTENSTGPAAKQVVTTYTYDAAGRLKSVSMAGHDKNGNAYTQPSRTFTYDGRGLLVSEWHPESNGVSYEYDAAGNMTARTDAQRTLRYEYDHAGRLTTVSEDGVGTLKELFYDRPNAAPDYSNGKLDKASRHNRQPYLGGGDIIVTEKYIYRGVGGRLSRKETSISTGETFTDSYVYDSLGSVIAVNMPKCTSCGALLPQNDRVIANTYKHGLLSSVLEIADPIEYHPNGLLKSIRHLKEDGTAGSLYEQTIDVTNGMARPQEIKVSSSCTGMTVLQNPSNATINQDQSTNLTFSVSGATSYTWYARTGISDTVVPGTTSTISVSPDVTTTYWARATKGTCTVDSTTAVVTVNACPPPAPSIASVSSMKASEVQTATASVASGITVTSYSWTMDSTAGEFTTATNGPTVSFRAKCSGTVMLRLTVTTSCTSGEATRSIPITQANASLSAQPLTIAQGSSTTLTAVLTGTGPWNVTWSDNLQPKTGVPSPVTRSASPVRKTTYTATATDPHGCSDTSNTVTVTVTPPAPTNVVAEAVSATSVNVTWSFSGTADSFEILRLDRAPGSPAGYRVVGTSLTNSFTNTSVPAGIACLYRVRAIVSGTPSADSGFDLATTSMFTHSPAAGTMIEDLDILELRTAVNAVRVLATLPAASFTDASLAGTWVKNVHVHEIRTALDAARSTLQLPAVVYSDQPLDAGDSVQAAHMNQLRGGVK